MAAEYVQPVPCVFAVCDARRAELLQARAVEEDVDGVAFEVAALHHHRARPRGRAARAPPRASSSSVRTGRPSSASASSRFGVRTSASGEEPLDVGLLGVAVEQAVAALGHHHRDPPPGGGGASRATASATASMMARLASMPVFAAATGMSEATASIWATTIRGSSAT